MSWHFLQGQEVVSSAAIYWDGTQFAPSRSTIMLEGSCWLGSGTGAYPDSRYGTISPPSTENPGAGGSMLSVEDSPARTSARPEKAQASPEAAAGYGLTWPASSARFDRDSASWKIHPCLFPGDSIPCSVTLPKWGTMRDGELSERTMPGPYTSGTGSGFWATPCATDSNPITGGNLYQTKSGTVRHMREDGRSSNRGLTAQVIWPTIRSTDGDRGGRGDLIQAVRGNENSHYKLFATPAARDAKGANSREHCETRGTGRKHMGQLANQVAHPDLAGIAATPSTTNCSGVTDAPTAAGNLWQTPVARDHFPPHSAAYVAKKRAEGHGMRNLNDEVAFFPTPTKSDGCGGPGSSGREGGDNLRTAINGALNPDWVEWLMGWPIGWTRLEPLAELRWEPLGVEPEDVPRVAVGVAQRQARLRCIGNGQVPHVAALALELLIIMREPEQL